jgi:uncharacterized protein (TIGR03435 family)
MVKRVPFLLLVAAVSAPLVWTTHAQVEQSQQAAPAFEVVSVRPEDPDGMVHMVKMSFSEDGYRAENATVWMLIKDAYGVGDKQILGAPDWAKSARFEIDARFDTETAERLGKMNAAGQKLAHQAMLQSLLLDRFMMALHRDNKELPIYTLVVAKSGSKLHGAKPGDDYANGMRGATGQLVVPHMLYMRLGGGRISGQGVPLEYLVQQLSSQLGMPVQDKTGLTDSYDFTLEWEPENIRRQSVYDSGDGSQQNQEAAASEAGGPSLAAALEMQLGLRLEVQKGPVEILMIDHIERPSQN